MDELKPGGWLRKSTISNGAAYCMVCKTELKNHLGDLKKHVKTQKHIKNIKLRDFQKPATALMATTSGKYLNLHKCISHE